MSKVCGSPPSIWKAKPDWGLLRRRPPPLGIRSKSAKLPVVQARKRALYASGSTSPYRFCGRPFVKHPIRFGRASSSPLDFIDARGRLLCASAASCRNSKDLRRRELSGLCFVALPSSLGKGSARRAPLKSLLLVRRSSISVDGSVSVEFIPCSVKNLLRNSGIHSEDSNAQG